MSGRAIPLAFCFLLLSFAILHTSTPSSAEQARSAASEGTGAGERRAGGDAPKQPDAATLEQWRKAKPRVRQIPKGVTPDTMRRSGAQPRMDFGAVTKKIGGEITKKPVGEEVERALKKQRAPSPKRNGAQTFEGAVEAAPAGPGERTVFGPDDRVRIHYVTEYPFRTIGQLIMTDVDGNTGTCSGTLIAPGYVLTAAHCLFDEGTGQFMDSVVFVPGMNGDNNMPNGYYNAAYLTVLAGYANAPSGEYSFEHMLHDLGIIELERDAGNFLGWLGYGYDDDLPPFIGNIVGYPADKPYGTMWRASCDIDPIDGEPDWFLTECDTYPGSSGSSVYDFDGRTTSRTIYGVNVAENPFTNIAVRLTGPYYCWVEWQIGNEC